MCYNKDMKIKLGYGAGFQEAEVPDNCILKILEQNDISDADGDDAVGADRDADAAGGDAAGSVSDILRGALANPIGTARLRDIVKPGEKIAIITSDVTRPMPTWEVMPVVLEELEAAGIKLPAGPDEPKNNDITLVFALGSHRAHSEEERRRLAGVAYEKINCIDSDPSDCVHFGTTSRDTPVDITRVVAEADRIVLLGNVEYHYFAGYSGGIKALFPGASTPEAIQANHAMMVEAAACAGNLDSNPLRQDLEEAARLCPVDFILNVVLDEHKHIVHAVAGDVVKAHREGCKYLDRLYRVEIPQRADIVIVSQGGAPKDLNLYQTQKALDNSKHAIKDGGTIILVGSCREGLGQKVFEEWITTAKAPADLTRRVREDFRLGGHKAAAIAMVLERANIKLVSEMDPGFVRNIFLEPYADLQQAVDDALTEQRAKLAAQHAELTEPTIIIMPYGGSTLPSM